MIIPKIDEFRLILQKETLNIEDIEDWENIAKDMIFEFAERAKLNQLFGEFEEQNGGRVSIYTDGLTFNIPYYCHFAWHPTMPKNGVLVDISAQFLKEWQKKYFEKYNEKIEVYQILQMIESDDYSSRLSRCDVAIDFVDEDITVNDIYRSLSDKRSEFRHAT